MRRDFDNVGSRQRWSHDAATCRSGQGLGGGERFRVALQQLRQRDDLQRDFIVASRRTCLQSDLQWQTLEGFAQKSGFLGADEVVVEA